jgi:iron(III) transport system substrate-binding protein
VAPAILDAAQKEATVTWDTSLTAATLTAVVRRFEQSHRGITVQTLRLTSNVMLARIIAEQRGGMFAADVVNTSALAILQLSSAGALQAYHPVDADKFMPGSVDPKGQWVTLFSSGNVLAWNPQRLAIDGLKPPASFDDLTKPEWRGKIGLDSSAVEFYQGLSETRSTSSVEKLIKGIMSNHPLLTQGHSNTLARLEAGEFDVTPTAYDFLADHDHRAGLPVDFVNPQPLFIDRAPIALLKNAPHPNAARVLIDWLLSKEGQSALVEFGGNISPRVDVDNIPTMLNAKTSLHLLGLLSSSEYNALARQYNQLLGAPN